MEEQFPKNIQQIGELCIEYDFLLEDQLYFDNQMIVVQDKVDPQIIFQYNKEKINLLDQILIKMKRSLNDCIIILFLSTLIVVASPLNAVAYGNFTHQQQNTILRVVHQAHESPSLNKAQMITLGLEKQMDQHWYVFYIVKSSLDDQVHDAVFYGYAFRNRWLWINNFQPGVSVIIWKDYNCGEVISLALNETDTYFSKMMDPADKWTQNYNSFTNDQLPNYETVYMNDPWKLADDLTVAVQGGTTNNPGYAFTTVMIELQNLFSPTTTKISYSICITKKDSLIYTNGISASLLYDRMKMYTWRVR